MNRMIFMTGGAFTTRAREFLERVDCPWLEKPVDTARLRLLLQEQLRTLSRPTAAAG